MFGLRPGDFARGRALVVYHFLVICASMTGRVARDAIFLEHFPASQLPLADIAAAVLAGVVVAAVIRAGRRVDARRVPQATLIIFIASLVALWWGLHTRLAAPMASVLYVWGGIIAPLMVTQVWTIAGQVWTSREAKRLFGLLGSGGIAGGIIGGVLARTIAQHIGAEAMLLAMAVVLLPCPFLVEAAWRLAPNATTPGTTSDSAAPRSLADSARLVIGSPHLRGIALLLVMAALTTTLVGWQMKAVASAALGSKNELAAYLGTFTAIAGAISLVFQLAITAPFLRRFGVGIALLILPLSLMLGATAVLLTSALWAVTAMRGCDAVLRYSLDSSSVQLLYLPVPAHQKSQAKSFIDAVLCKFGDGGAGVIIFVAAGIWHITPQHMSVVTLLLSAGWIAAAVSVRRAYVAALRSNIQHATLKPDPEAVPMLDQVTAEVFEEKLASTNQSDVLYALDLLEIGQQLQSDGAVRGLLQHPSPHVRRKALALLTKTGDASVAETARGLLSDASPEVRTEALRYLMQHGNEDPLERIEDLTEFAGESVRSAAIVMLARTGDDDTLDAARIILDHMVRAAGPSGKADRLEAAQIMSIIPPAFGEQLSLLLHDIDDDVRREAICTAGQLRLAAFMPALIDLLADDRFTADATQALARFGDGAVESLCARFDDLSASPVLRLAVPSVLVKIGTAHAAIALADHLLQPDLALRSRVISALNKLHHSRRVLDADRSHIETAMTAELMGHYRSYQQLGAQGGVTDDALQEAMTAEVERIFRLLKLLYPAVDLEAAFYGVQSRDAATHANALEFLDNTLPPKIRTLLVPLVDVEVTAAERGALADRFLGFSETSARRPS